MLLPDQTYEQASLRQERHRRLPGCDDEFGRLLALKQTLVGDVRRSLGGAGDAEHLFGDTLSANNEMKFGGTPDDGALGSGSSSGVGSSGTRGRTRSQTLDVRLTKAGPRTGNDTSVYLDVESIWSRPASVMANPGPPGPGSNSLQRAPPAQEGSGRTDQGIGLGSVSSPCSSLSYSSDSSDDAAGRGNRRSRRAGKQEAKPTITSPNKQPLAMATERDDYERTSDFFNNIPEFQGEALGPFSIAGKGAEPDWGSIRTNVDILRACELFLMHHRIRPDFFCKYKKAMNPSASAPASFPLSRSRTPIAVRKPKSASPSMQRPASRAQGSARPAGPDRSPATAAAGGGGPIYSVPNRAGKKRRPNAVY
ncbi:uncharacterized protein LOC131207977 [Anopheles bellator]|uniref:uncharacterized protein LOC131207977 n=1 Tax=Anopheles bellator TaxID=139047 RepID=UPI0026498D87|nr:uncharacterized protein LOC131207977 [Anopheles bellator]